MTIVSLVSSLTQMALVVIREVSCSVFLPMHENTNHAMEGVITQEKHILSLKENVKYKAYTTMNKLIEVAEELYKQIDKAQVHLVNARLNNNEEGKKSAISEMETAMCNAMQLLKCFIDRNDKEQKADNVNHPAHYNSHPSGIECIEIARHHNFNIGNTIKYLWRAGLKSEEGMEDTDKQVEDLNKAIWYIKDEIKRITEFDTSHKTKA